MGERGDGPTGDVGDDEEIFLGLLAVELRFFSLVACCT